MRRGGYVLRGIAIAAFGALIIASAALYLSIRPPTGAGASQLIEVECLKLDSGPTLRFEKGALINSGETVGTYRFRGSVPGKYGPRIEVQGVSVREGDGGIVIRPGNEGWFWPYQDKNTVKIFYYPQNSTLAHRCAV